MTRRLAEMTWTEFRDSVGEATVAILATGAIEAHGPHLPLSTDVIIAEAMAEAAAARLADAGRAPILLPTLAYTSAGFAAGFPGTVSMSPEVVSRTVVDLGRSLARAGVPTLALANSHFDPVHLGSLRGAVDTLRAELPELAVVYPDLTRKPWALRLTSEFKSGACHAGRYEGSIVLAARPELVRRELMTDLADNPMSLSEAIRAGRTSFEAAGGDQAYFGYPREASAEEGNATIATLGGILCEAVLQPPEGSA